MHTDWTRFEQQSTITADRRRTMARQGKPGVLPEIPTNSYGQREKQRPSHSLRPG